MRTVRSGAACALIALSAASPAAAAPEPIDGPIAFVTARHPFTGLSQNVAGAYAGWIGERDASFPRAGDVFYLHGVVAVTGTLDDVPILTFRADPALLPDIGFAIEPEHPVRCLFYPRIDGTPEPDPASCSQEPTGTLSDGAFFGARGEMTPGQGFEVQVPVRVTRPKAGLASGAEAQFGVHLRSAWGEALAVQSLVVAPALATPAAGGPPAASPAAAGPAPADVRPPRAARIAAVAGPRTRRGRAVRLRLRLSEPARVDVRLARRARPGAPFRSVGRPLTRRLPAGAAVVALGRLRAGSYRVLLRVRDAAGNASTARATFAVRR